MPGEARMQPNAHDAPAPRIARDLCTPASHTQNVYCDTQVFLNNLDEKGSTEDVMREVLVPMQLACNSSMAKIVDLALGCLHKLVAHAWLHGESTPSGSMDMLTAFGSMDGDDTAAQVRHSEGAKREAHHGGQEPWAAAAAGRRHAGKGSTTSIWQQSQQQGWRQLCRKRLCAANAVRCAAAAERMH